MESWRSQTTMDFQELMQRISEAAQEKEKFSNRLKLLLEGAPRENVIDWTRPGENLRYSRPASVPDDIRTLSFSEDDALLPSLDSIELDDLFSDVKQRSFSESAVNALNDSLTMMGATNMWPNELLWRFWEPNANVTSPLSCKSTSSESSLLGDEDIFNYTDLKSEKELKTTEPIIMGKQNNGTCPIPIDDLISACKKEEIKVKKEENKICAKVQPRRGAKNKAQQAKEKKKETKRHMKPRLKPNNCIHLHEFLQEMLEKNETGIAWTSVQNREFRLIDSDRVAKCWGERKNKEGMTYDKMARSLRYYYKLGIMNRVPNKRLHFAFGEAKVWKKV